MLSVIHTHVVVWYLPAAASISCYKLYDRSAKLYSLFFLSIYIYTLVYNNMTFSRVDCYTLTLSTPYSMHLHCDHNETIDQDELSAANCSSIQQTVNCWYNFSVYHITSSGRYYIYIFFYSLFYCTSVYWVDRTVSYFLFFFLLLLWLFQTL